MARNDYGSMPSVFSDTHNNMTCVLRECYSITCWNFEFRVKNFEFRVKIFEFRVEISSFELKFSSFELKFRVSSSNNSKLEISTRNSKFSTRNSIKRNPRVKKGPHQLIMCIESLLRYYIMRNKMIVLIYYMSKDDYADKSYVLQGDHAAQHCWLTHCTL